MKKLYLLRHAMSRRGIRLLSDYDRPLNDRGRSQAEAMGRYFQENAFEIDKILCSGALRTRQTLDLLLEAYDYQGKIEYKDESTLHPFLPSRCSSGKRAQTPFSSSATILR